MFELLVIYRYQEGGFGEEIKISPYLIQKGRWIVFQVYVSLQLSSQTIHLSKQNNFDDFHEKVLSPPVAGVHNIYLAITKNCTHLITNIVY